MLDGVGWQTAPVAVPEGIRLLNLPPYSPELQPAETFWIHVDRQLKTLEDLGAAGATRCVTLANDRDLIQGQTGFHWWPKRTVPT